MSDTKTCQHQPVRVCITLVNMIFKPKVAHTGLLHMSSVDTFHVEAPHLHHQKQEVVFMNIKLFVLWLLDEAASPPQMSCCTL